MSLAAIIQRRQRALLGAWRANSFFQVQVETPAELGRVVFIGDDEGAGSSGPLGRRRPGSVAYVTRDAESPDAEASVWVAAGYDGYRSAYLAFARKAYGIRVTPSDLAGYDADHLLNRARSPADSTFIRLEAVPAKVNQAWGALYEKAASSPAFYANTHRHGRKMSWMVASKFAGQMPPQGPDDKAGIDRLVSFWVEQRFPKEQAEYCIRDDLNRVFGRPHGGVVTPTEPWI